jgi:hypothetical protein
LSANLANSAKEGRIQKWGILDVPWLLQMIMLLQMIIPGRRARFPRMKLGYCKAWASSQDWNWLAGLGASRAPGLVDLGLGAFLSPSQVFPKGENFRVLALLMAI